MITRDYVRGFVDGEGGFNYAALQFYNTDQSLMRSINEFLISEGYTPHGLLTPWKGTNKPCYRIALSGVKDLAKFAVEIGFEIKEKQTRLENYIKKCCLPKKVYNLREYYIYLDGIKNGIGITQIAKNMGVVLCSAQYRRDNVYPIEDNVIFYLDRFQPDPGKI